MGGLGALVLAFRHPDLFSAVVSHRGVDLAALRGPTPVRQGQERPVPGRRHREVGRRRRADRRLGARDLRRRFCRLAGASIRRWLAGLKDGQLAIYLDCGTEDDFGLDAQASYLDEVLTAHKITHTFFEGPGGHNLDFWGTRLPISLTFLAGALHSK